MENFNTHAGYIAILGRPNVGKSTLLNRILGKKISITARRAQTTRHKILGIKTTENTQFVYIDTPGVHGGGKNKLNRYMNKAAIDSLADVDVIIFMVSGTIWNDGDELVLQVLSKVKTPVVLVINKVDLVTKKATLLSYINKISQKYQFVDVVPVSAKDSTNIDALEKAVQGILPINPFFFDASQVTDRDNKFLVAEIIREKLTRFLGNELPYVISVMVDSMEFKKKMFFIDATIYTERRSQKAIIVGKDGLMLKKIATSARHDIEELLGKQVFLKLWVKVKERWTSDDKLLHRFGYS